MDSETKRVVRFDNQSHNWASDSRYNQMFLQTQTKWANYALKVRGHLFLNELHDCLGLPRTSEGQLVGWLFTNNNPIEFVMYESNGVIDLEFHVDGVIYDKIEGE